MASGVAVQVTTRLSHLGAGQVPQGTPGATEVSRALSHRPSQSEPDLTCQDLGHWVGGLGLALLLGHLPLPLPGMVWPGALAPAVLVSEPVGAGALQSRSPRQAGIRWRELSPGGLEGPHLGSGWSRGPLSKAVQSSQPRGFLVVTLAKPPAPAWLPLFRAFCLWLPAP